MSSRNIPFWFIWILPFVSLIFLTVGLVAFLSLRNGQQAVDDMAAQLIERTNQLVTQHLESYLTVPKNLVKMDAAALENGMLDWQAFTALGDYFWQQATMYHLSWINYGLDSGEYAGAGYDDDHGMMISELSPATNMQYFDFPTNEQGQRIATDTDPNYDYRKEAWYLDAMQAGKLIWSEIYLWEGTYTILSSTMAVAISQPIFLGSEQPVGAIGIDLSLTNISDFLRTLQISPSARVFIIEEDGMVVATSSTEAPFTQINDQLERLNITKSTDPLIQATTDYLIKQVGSFDRIQANAAFQFLWNHERQFVRVTPWHDDLGLSWLVVMVVSESDFMAQINANTRQTIWLSAGALVAAIILGYFTSRFITHPIAALKVVAQRIAAGHLEQQVAPNAIRELDAVGQSFNRMAVQLQDSFTKLAYTASHDALTGLPNRATFQRLLTEAIVHRHLQTQSSAISTHPALLAVLFLDLDYFKVLNDSLGHWAGDQVLIETANRLRTCIQNHGHVARLGGDEFVILLDQLVQPSDVEAIVKQLLSVIQKPFVLNDTSAIISTSIGVAFSSNYITDADSMLRNADIALYRAKANGKAVYEVFDDEMHVEVMERLQLETDLRRALEAINGEQNELAVYYQPIIDTNTLVIVGVEALLRWQHPKLGMIQPTKFIPIAEETGLLIPLGWWVLRTACRQMQEWRQLFPGTLRLVNVNLSSRQFLHPALFYQVSQILHETGLPPQALKLEITESLLSGDRITMQARLAQLKALGIQLSLDDFGTGFSSLSYLQHYPLDTLKIDRSFVQQILSNERCRAIVESVIAMAHKLGIDVVAEGVETQETLDYLRDVAHCEQIQGFLISSAVSAAEIECQISKQRTMKIGEFTQRGIRCNGNQLVQI